MRKSGASSREPGGHPEDIPWGAGQGADPLVWEPGEGRCPKGQELRACLRGQVRAGRWETRPAQAAGRAVPNLESQAALVGLRSAEGQRMCVEGNAEGTTQRKEATLPTRGLASCPSACSSPPEVSVLELHLQQKSSGKGLPDPSGDPRGPSQYTEGRRVSIAEPPAPGTDLHPGQVPVPSRQIAGPKLTCQGAARPRSLRVTRR